MVLDMRPARVEALRRAQLRPPKEIPPEGLPLRQLSREPEFPLRPLPSRPRYRKGALRSGYAFSQQPGWGRLITEGKLWDALDALNLEIYPSAVNSGHSQPPYLLLEYQKDMPSTSVAAMHKTSLPPALDVISPPPVASSDTTTLTSPSKPPLAAMESFGLDETDSLLDSKHD